MFVMSNLYEAEVGEGKHVIPTNSLKGEPFM